MFFFEKKNEKTFACFFSAQADVRCARWEQRKSKSFLLLFVKKMLCFLSCDLT